MTNAVQTRDSDQSLMVSEREMHALSVREITDQVKLIQTVMRDVMKDGEHYGKIPGCGDKPALLKPGAEKLGMTFRLAPRFDVRRTDYPNGHREYEITCTLNDRHQGVGACSTLEAKYRYRTGPKKFTGKPVPKDYWNLRGSNPAKASEMIGGKGFAVGKNDVGQWEICEAGEKVEHDNPADHWNTVLKMAKKRAHVDAILTATAASDIFAQDIDEFADNGVEVNPAAETPTKTVVDASQSAPRNSPPPQQADPENDGYEPSGEADTDAEPAQAGEEWREFPMPYGKNAGSPLANLSKNYLFGLWANFTVESEYNGKPKKPETIAKDQKLRDMLDQAGKHYKFSKD